MWIHMNKLLLVDFYQQIVQIAITHEQTLNNLINRKVFILLRSILTNESDPFKSEWNSPPKTEECEPIFRFE